MSHCEGGVVLHDARFAILGIGQDESVTNPLRPQDLADAHAAVEGAPDC